MKFLKMSLVIAGFWSLPWWAMAQQALTWDQLSEDQRELLAPLEQRWNQLSA